MSNENTASKGVGSTGGSAGFWAARHEDHDTGLHGPHPKFATEAEARAACERWNKDIPGHHYYYVSPAPPEFTSWPNVKSEPRGGQTL